VSDCDRSFQPSRCRSGTERRVLSQLLAPLGYPLLMRDGDAIGFGVDAWRFGLIATKSPIIPLHVTFAATDRDQVDQFFAAALAAGGQARGAPGVRAHYDPNYYAAYVTDPDGHNVEAVCRQPQQL
jgi:catechol 2,3-dioxygenase-like lactoylglutathione lyase family enzyme